MRGVCIFSWFADTMKYAVQCGICWEVIYWQCRLRCKIHTCCCQGFLSKYEPLHHGSELFVCCFSWVSQRCNFLTAANVITAAGQTVTGCLCIYRIFITVEVNQIKIFVCHGAIFCTSVGQSVTDFRFDFPKMHMKHTTSYSLSSIYWIYKFSNGILLAIKIMKLIFSFLFVHFRKSRNLLSVSKH